MATACLREDRWLVHHLASDLPVAEVTQLALDTHARLVVLSAATAESARRARRAAKEIRTAAPGLRVLAGPPGDTLGQLRELAGVAAEYEAATTTAEAEAQQDAAKAQREAAEAQQDAAKARREAAEAE